MMTSDLIAIGILVFCIALSMLGILKWLFRFFAGVVLGLLVLSCIGLLADNPKFDELSRGKFRGGKVIPCIRSQVQSVGEFLARADEELRSTVAVNE